MNSRANLLSLINYTLLIRGIPFLYLSLIGELKVKYCFIRPPLMNSWQFIFYNSNKIRKFVVVENKTNSHKH